MCGASSTTSPGALPCRRPPPSTQRRGCQGQGPGWGARSTWNEGAGWRGGEPSPTRACPLGRPEPARGARGPNDGAAQGPAPHGQGTTFLSLSLQERMRLSCPV